MNRRTVLIASIVFLAGIFITGILVLREKTDLQSDPLRAVPSDAAFILQINDFHELSGELFSKNEILQDLMSFEVFNKLGREILFIDSIAGTNRTLSSLILDATTYVSGHHIGGRKVDYLFILSSRSQPTPREIVNALGTVAGFDVTEAERRYEGENILSISLSKERQDLLYVASMEGSVLVSRSVILIENAIRQRQLSESITNDERFMEIASTAGKNKSANLFIDLRRFTAYLSSIASDNFSPRLRKTKNFGGWVELDLNVNTRQIMLNGFVDPGPDQESFLQMFADSDPIGFSVDKILPASVSAFISFGAEELPVVQQKFIRYLAGNGKLSARENRLKELDKQYDIRFEEIFTSLLDNEITYAQAGYKQGDSDKPAGFIILKCKSGDQAEKTLGSVVDKMARAQGISPVDLKEEYRVDSETRFALVKFPAENVTGLLFGDLFGITGNTYYTFLGNYLIFSESTDALGHFLYSNVLSRTLSTNPAYKKFSNNIDQESYMLFYTNLSRSSGVFRKYLSTEIISAWEQNYDQLQKIQSLGVQYTEVSNRGYYNIILQYIDEAKGKPQTIWESLLDTSFTFKPQLVENHYTHQKEIFLQDRNNTIYLINKAGRVLWKQTISEPISSEVYQIDYYKNGKLQLLFSTANYLHLIDRNGNYVERYPVRLRERSTAGMSLFDYEDNRNYRIFIPCANHEVYAYSKDGSLISGWSFEGSEHTVTKPAKHFRIGDKDYIVLSDKFRTYILDRRGSIRVPVSKLFLKAENSEIYLDDGTSPEDSYLYTTDTSGTVVRIGFDGKVQTMHIEDFSPNHFFDLKDVDADGSKDFIFVDGEELYVFNRDKAEILHFTFPNIIEKPPIYFRFAYSDRKLGICDPVGQKIYLINNDGKLYKGFPLEGNTLFSIGYLESTEGEFNLIVGGRNNFLYNYSVQ